MSDENKKKMDSKVKKLVFIVITALLLLIPVGCISGVISDRVDNRYEATQTVKKSWAKEQILKAPQMFFKVKKSQKEEEIKNLKLNNYFINTQIKTEIRKKGIYKVPVYVSEIKMRGDFLNEYGDLSDKNISVNFDVSDVRGFVSEPIFKINDMPAQSLNKTTYDCKLKTNAKFIPFEISYQIKGSNDIFVDLKGVNNKIQISGNWKDPSFIGDYLPAKRTVTKKDFSAEWSIPQIALLEAKEPPKIGVSLLVPVDNYKMADRSLSYALLLLILTFLSYFIFEITSKTEKKVHPVQYCLLGGAILIFYLLLISLSEVLDFGLAYLIASLMILGMVFNYTYFVITKKQSLSFGIIVTSLLAILYSFFYILLSLQDVSLLVGSIGLFFIMSCIMYLTRNINWYNEGEQN